MMQLSARSAYLAGHKELLKKTNNNPIFKLCKPGMFQKNCEPIWYGTGTVRAQCQQCSLINTIRKISTPYQLEMVCYHEWSPNRRDRTLRAFQARPCSCTAAQRGVYNKGQH